MTPKELAAHLHGSEYPFKLPKALAHIVKENGLVVVYGASDDLMEFEGAINNELGCYEGGVAYVTPKGLLENKCEDPDCPYHAEERKTAKPINAIFGENACTWTYKTRIPHETFDIIEDDETYCKGIVFALCDVELETDYSERLQLLPAKGRSDESETLYNNSILA